MRSFKSYLFLSSKIILNVCMDFPGNYIQILFHIFIIFRQRKLEKVMEEEGLKDEEVIEVRIFFS